MSALFTASSWHEIHRDPGGHYHHWNIVVGTLDRGTLRRGDHLLHRARDGRRLTSVLRDADARNRVLPHPLSADQVTGETVALVLWRPAHGQDVLAEAGSLTLCDEAEHRSALRELILSGWPHCPCPDCCSALRPICDAEQGLWDAVRWREHPHGYRPRR
jgi:hypothetical protein